MHDDFTDDQLTVAFSFQLVHRIVGADGVVSPEEQALLDRLFPVARLQALGFADSAGGFTQAWHDALSEALLSLPTRLDEGQRLDLIKTLWDAAQADDHLHPDEAKAVEHAARLLGLPRDRVAAHLFRG